MRYKKSLSYIMIIFICSTFLNGCYNYRDINKVLFVTSVIIDIDDLKRPVVYIETFKPYRASTKGSEKGERIIYRGEGKTIFESIRNINLSSSYKINYTQNRAIIFTKKAAEYGLDNFTDFFQRDQELLIRAYPYIFMGDAKALISLKLKEEEYIGLFLSELIRNQGNASRTVSLDFKNYMNESLLGSKTVVMTAFSIKENSIGDKLELSGGGVIKDGKMIEYMEIGDVEKYNFINNKVSRGTLEEFNPDEPNKFVTLEILKSNTKTERIYDGKSYKLIKIINVNSSIAEAEGKMNFDSDTIQKVKSEAERSIKEKCSELFEEYKKKDIDVFNIQSDFQRKFPNEENNNIIKITEMEIEPHVKIEGSSDIGSKIN